MEEATLDFMMERTRTQIAYEMYKNPMSYATNYQWLLTKLKNINDELKEASKRIEELKECL